MKNFWTLAAVLSCLLCGGQLKAQTQGPRDAAAARREVAFTVDDLPSAYETGGLPEIQSMTRALTRALARHRIPAVGFVNERKLYVRGQTDARIDLLRQWLDAGMTLGNHTFSHADFQTTPLDEYRDEVVRGDIVTRQLMRERGHDKLYFRYPYNHTGPSREAKQALETFLRSRGYQIAPFTVEHEDYIFAPVYDRLRLKGDAATARRVRRAYLEYLDTKFDYYERRSRQMLGYEVKQIFLIHANRLNADCMDEMVARLKRRGYAFVTLDRALEDKAYSLADEYVGGTGISWLHRWMIALGRELDYRDDPDAPAFVYELFRAQQASR